MHDAENIILSEWTKATLGEVAAGNIGAFSTEDESTDGYYLVRFTSGPYTLADATTLTEFDPPIIVPEGELVVDCEYGILPLCAPSSKMVHTIFS
mmetsp:Transcript_30705/g.50713  ORF Transcript_30705/g.50713 Transcript_30705/m.50713 type:complete len:95 (-) Transcript_30705:258-542(-)